MSTGSKGSSDRFCWRLSRTTSRISLTVPAVLKEEGTKNSFVWMQKRPSNAIAWSQVECLTAEKLFDARWAMTLLAEVLNRLRQAYAREGKTSTFEALNVFLDPVSSRTPPSYEEVANRLQVSTGAVKTLIHRLRKRYTTLLREEVGRTLSDPAEIDEEIHALCEALIASEGRLGP